MQTNQCSRQDFQGIFPRTLRHGPFVTTTGHHAKPSKLLKTRAWMTPEGNNGYQLEWPSNELSTRRSPVQPVAATM